MKQSRRWFLRTLGAGAAFAALPEISPIIGMIDFPGGRREGFEQTIADLLLGREPGGPFVAHAETHVTGSTAKRLMDSPRALLEMIERQGLERNFSSRPDYTEAAQCKENYKRKADGWGNRGFTDYTAVHRPQADTDASLIMAVKTDGSRHIIEAEGATQYQSHPAIALSGHDPAALLVGWWLLEEAYTLSRRHATQALTAIEKRSVEVDKRQGAMRYETPVSAVIHVPRAPRNSRLGRRSAGLVFAHNKKDQVNPNQIYYSEVFV